METGEEALQTCEHFSTLSKRNEKKVFITDCETHKYELYSCCAECQNEIYRKFMKGHYCPMCPQDKHWNPLPLFRNFRADIAANFISLQFVGCTSLELHKNPENQAALESFEKAIKELEELWKDNSEQGEFYEKCGKILYVIQAFEISNKRLTQAELNEMFENSTTEEAEEHKNAAETVHGPKVPFYERFTSTVYTVIPLEKETEKLDLSYIEIPKRFACERIGTGKFLICGGYQKQFDEENNQLFDDISSSCYTLYFDETSSETCVFEKVENMSFARVGHQLVLCENFIYAIGGNYYQNYLRECEAYDLTTKTWKDIAPMEKARTRAIATHFGGAIYVIGGFVQFGSQDEHKTAEKYIPSLNQWQEIRFQAKVGIVPPLSGACTFSIGDKCYIAGGTNLAKALNRGDANNIVSKIEESAVGTEQKIEDDAEFVKEVYQISETANGKLDLKKVTRLHYGRSDARVAVSEDGDETVALILGGTEQDSYQPIFFKTQTGEFDAKATEGVSIGLKKVLESENINYADTFEDTTSTIAF